VFVRRGREAIVSSRGVEGPPDLVMELLSPSTAARDRGIKLDRYRLFGVGEYWVVDVDAGTIEMWKLADGATEAVVYTTSDALLWTPVAGGPTLEIPLANLFRAP